MVSTQKSVVVFAALFAIALGRPGAPSAPSVPSEDENTIPDYAYDAEDDVSTSRSYTTLYFIGRIYATQETEIKVHNIIADGHLRRRFTFGCTWFVSLRDPDDRARLRKFL